MLMGDPAHDRTEVGRIQVDEVHGVGDDAGRQRARLIATIAWFALLNTRINSGCAHERHA